MGCKKPRWTKKEKNHVIYHWGNEAPEKIAKDVGRSVPACRELLRREFGACGWRIDGYSIKSLSEATGYHWSAIKRAIVKLGIKSKTNGHKSSYRIITEEQAERIVDFLSGAQIPGSYSDVGLRLGVSYKVIASVVRILGITPFRNYDRIAPNGIPAARLDDNMQKEIREYLEWKNSLVFLHALRDELGLGRIVMQQAVVKAGVKLHTKKPGNAYAVTPAAADKIRAAVRSQKALTTMSALARKIGCSYTKVFNAAAKAGIRRKVPRKGSPLMLSPYQVAKIEDVIYGR